MIPQVKRADGRQSQEGSRERGDPILVHRTRLVNVVQAEPPAVLTVAAPAGYGKTTLVDQWLAADGRRAVRLSLHPLDNDVDRFVERLGASFAGDSCVLVLDDAHHVAAPDAIEVLRALATRVPLGSTLVVISRAHADLSLGLVRAQRLVIELDSTSLALDDGEAAEICEHAGLALTDAQISELVERTEGWAAAIQMAARAAVQSADPIRTIVEFAGDDRSLVELLDNEVFDGLSVEAIDFLVAVAPMQRVSGPLCDAVLQRTGSAALLERLAQETLLVLPLDRRRVWYRFHHVLLAFLRSDQHERIGTPPDEIAVRASVWFETHGDIDSAIEMAAVGNDVSRATDLVLEHFSAQSSIGNPEAVEQWLSRLTSDRVVNNPSLQAVAALARMGLGDPDGTLRCLQRAEFGLAERYPTDGPQEQPAAVVAALRALVGWGTAESMREDARYARQHTKSPVWYAVASLSDGAASFMLGDTAAALEAFHACIAIAEKCNYTSWAMSLAHLALLHERAGDREAAMASALAAQRVVIDLDLHRVPHLYLVHLVGAQFEALAGRDEQSAASRVHGLALFDQCRSIGPWAQLQGSIVVANLAHMWGDNETKTAWLDLADTVLDSLADALLVKDQVSEVRSRKPAPPRGGPESPTLSGAERRVLHYLPTHLSLAEIADKLFLSRHTVKSHVVAIYRKLEVASRSEAVGVARAVGLLD